MALINCQECGKEFSDKAAACPNCACPVSNSSDDEMDFPIEVNGKRIDLFDITLDKVKPGSKKIGMMDSGAIIMEIQKRAGSDVKDARAAWNNNVSAIERMYAEYTAASDDGQARCPKCNSTSLTGQKKGFGVGKALVGGLLTPLGIGLVAGNIGAKKVRVTCMKCGKQFWAGKQ
jgi:DNA-directed RNA polymerase subunit RPC12/RpoP